MSLRMFSRKNLLLISRERSIISGDKWTLSVLVLLRADQDSQPEVDRDFLCPLSPLVSPRCCEITTLESEWPIPILLHTNNGTSPAFDKVRCLSFVIIYMFLFIYI